MIEYDGRSWFKVITRLRGSVFLALMPRVALATVISICAVYWQMHARIGVPTTAHTLVGVALGLLLVFRTNASYDRYWEGRKLLGSIVNRSRDLLRQTSAFIEGDDAEARVVRAQIQRLVTVLYALIRQYLRGERDLNALGASITEDERARLEPIAVRPCIAAQWLSVLVADQVRAKRMPPQGWQLMDPNITSIVDSWGGAERIMKTPVPFAYAHHIKTFLTLFCFTLPFALAESMKFLTPLAVAIVSYGMFGIEEIGVEIEDPFGYDANDLPLDKVGETIARDTRDILAERDGTRAVQAA